MSVLHRAQGTTAAYKHVVFYDMSMARHHVRSWHIQRFTRHGRGI